MSNLKEILDEFSLLKYKEINDFNKEKEKEINDLQNELRKNYKENTTIVGSFFYQKTSSYFDENENEELLLKKIENKTIELTSEQIEQILKILEGN